MSAARRLVLGLFEFIVGDDWRIAVGVVGALGLTSVIAAAEIAAWWVMPAAVFTFLTFSIRRAARRLSGR